MCGGAIKREKIDTILLEMILLVSESRRSSSKPPIGWSKARDLEPPRQGERPSATLLNPVKRTSQAGDMLAAGPILAGARVW